MKKIIALLLSLAMMFSLVACSVEKDDGQQSGGDVVSTEQSGGETATATAITLWTYPIGGWGDQATVDALIAGFEQATGVKVTVEYLTYADGDDKVNTAIEGNAAPDLIMEGPERLVANWGAKGKMVNIADLFDATDKAEINPAALAACFADANTAYEYPLVMTAHCMAINKTVFEAAGAMQYIDEATHTWKSVADFEAAVAAVYAATNKTVGAVYCVGQGGDQGTRALVNNLCGGTFTNAEHTEYTWGSEENIAALKKLYDNPAIAYDAGIAGGDEIALFYNGTLNMAFCWNIAQQLNPNTANTGAAKTASGDDIMFLAFPSDSTPKLQGGIWGFGIFDNGDAAKIAAAKEFIKYFCDSAATIDAVKAANYFAVRDTAEGTDLSSIWADNAIMAEYNVLMPLLGDYYQVTTGWAEARTCWWNMLQKVGASDGSVDAITAAVNEYVNQANGK
ncbi:MAG: extracellular solute-binding protein [Roseburia sp.]|nr:extracellular solute-binding protein [Roseburia sp.]